MFNSFFRTAAILALTGFLVSPANAQSGAKYSTAENRPQCKIWNPNPQPNETVYWTGRCQGGYAEGKGIVTWGNVVNGRAQISVSDVTLKRGQQTGYGEYFSRNGQSTQREYKNGKVVSAGKISQGMGTEAVKSDLFASRFKNGLIKSVSDSDLKAISDYMGFELIAETKIGGQPVISTRDPKKGNRIMMIAAACGASGNNCKGIVLGSGLKTDRALSFSEINSFNARYNMAKITRMDTDPKAFNLTHYVILNQGIRPDNLKVTLDSFSALIDNVEREFDARDSVEE